jgi:hypothetical protein
LPVAKDYTIYIEPTLRPALAPDERLLAASPLVSDPGSTEDVSVSDELKNLLDPTILLGLGSHPGNLVQRAAFGRAVTGAPDSMAHRLHAAIRDVTWPILAVTETRLVILDRELVHLGQGNWLQRWFGPTKDVVKVAHVVPREAIVGAVMAPVGLLRRGRFLVVFTDASSCAVACSVPRLGRRAAEAVGPPRLESGAPGEEQA